MKLIVASFLWHRVEGNRLLGSTRDDEIPFALTGGKSDPGEHPKETMLREAYEEGVALTGIRCVGYMEETIDDTDIKVYFWEPTGPYSFLNEYKEKERGIRPTTFTEEELRAIEAWHAFPDNPPPAEMML